MDQKSICLFLAANGLTAHAIHVKFEAVLHEKAVRDSTLAKYLRSASFGERDAVQADSDDTPDADLIDQAILQALIFRRFVSVRQISRMILLSKSTVYGHLTESFEFISKRLRWIPRRLSDIERKARVEKSRKPLQLLLINETLIMKVQGG
jgi:hypothetical protein